MTTEQRSHRYFSKMETFTWTVLRFCTPAQPTESWAVLASSPVNAAPVHWNDTLPGLFVWWKQTEHVRCWTSLRSLGDITVINSSGDTVKESKEKAFHRSHMLENTPSKDIFHTILNNYHLCCTEVTAIPWQYIGFSCVAIGSVGFTFQDNGRTARIQYLCPWSSCEIFWNYNDGPTVHHITWECQSNLQNGESTGRLPPGESTEASKFLQGKHAALRRGRQKVISWATTNHCCVWYYAVQVDWDTSSTNPCRILTLLCPEVHTHSPSDFLTSKFILWVLIIVLLMSMCIYVAIH